jgi:hypothetical protein
LVGVARIKCSKIKFVFFFGCQSRIHPLQIASNLPRESCEALHQSIEEVSVMGHHYVLNLLSTEVALYE